MKLAISIFLFIAFFISPFSFGENKSFNRERTFDVQHYKIGLKFNRSKKKVFSDSTIQIKPLEKDFKILELDAKDLNFESITLEQSGKNLKFANRDGKVTIFLDKAYQPNDLISVRFKYSTTNPKKGIYFVKAQKTGDLQRSSQIWTQGESEETHHWLPSFDFPDDKATTEQIITVKNSETVIANGKLHKKTDNKNGTTTFHYKMTQPHSLYLTSFVIGEFVRVSDKYRDIPLGFYVYPDTKSVIPKAYGKTKDMFKVFEDLTKVDYPFEKYDQTMVGNFAFGGMENITATTMSDVEIFYGSKNDVEDLVSHELAHSWFGNLVTCRNWAELWLNEGFATFMEAAFREKMYGRSNYMQKIQADADQYFAYAAVNDENLHGLFNRQADARNDETMFTPITYQKGSVIVHTLREELGEKAFWKGVNIYLKRHKFANVETKDAQKAFEEASGKDLNWFFKQWVYGTSYPKLKINQSYSPKTKELILKIEQNQKENEYTPKAFRLLFDVQISMSKAKKQKQIVIDKRQQTIRIPLDEKPFNVVFDKDNKIPLKSIRLSKLKITK